VVEVEGLRIGSEEEATNVGDSGLDSPPEAATVRFREGEGDVRRDHGVLAGELVDEGPISGKPGQRTAGRLPRGERFPKDLVGQEAIIGHQGEKWGRERGSEGNDEAPESGHSRKR